MEQQKVWFITGASKGFGLAFVKQLLSAGYKVAATSRNAAAIVAQFPAHEDILLALKVDITDEASVTDAIKQTIARFGRVDVVVNNAGYALFGSMEEVSAHEFRQSLDVNLVG